MRKRCSVLGIGLALIAGGGAQARVDLAGLNKDMAGP